MAESMRKQENPEDLAALEGFEEFFEGDTESAVEVTADATMSGEVMQQQVEKLLERMTELLSFSVDQRVESARMATQLIDNQRQLIATQQILIRLMERSIDLTRHISSIEEKLPVLFELPRTVESIRQRLVQMEGVEVE
ncbi:MAG TPA: hypothetical protein EYN91_02120 [Candidatus Melainabacteria bacterium]|jgi:hypothetical protein|nr:hypothetical protein [Candidatus Melainabacteria bacterium]HIN65470.1 hypothetical protein [Candidatus Obscuribacterales bacterium]